MAITDVSGPTPYGEVNLLLRAMLPELRLILGERFVGMYLYANND